MTIPNKLKITLIALAILATAAIAYVVWVGMALRRLG